MISRSISAIAALLVLCAISACVSRTQRSDLIVPIGSDVSMTEVVASDRTSYSGSTGVSFNRPFPHPGNVLPQYPAEKIDSRGDRVTLVVDVVVSESGTVDRVQAVGDMDSESMAFLRSIETAVKTWRFTPLIRTEIKDQVEAEGRKDSLVVSASLPFTQRYAFTFSRIDGSPVVRAAADPNGSE